MSLLGVPDQVEGSLFMNSLVHSYTCFSDRHASPYWTFIHRWISMGFTPSLLKNGWQNAVLHWCMLQAGPSSLHYYCAIVLHSCIVLPPVGHSSNHEYYCCQLTRQSSCVWNFYRTFKVFIWLSLASSNAFIACITLRNTKYAAKVVFCVSASLLSNFEQFTDVHEIWYGRCVNGTHPQPRTSFFRKSVILLM